jgi:hypothetical protein
VETTTDPSVETPESGGAAAAPRVLPAHESLSRTPVFGGAALAPGLLLVGLAAWIAVAAADVVHVGGAAFHAPRIVGLAGAGTFGLAGLALAAYGFRGIVRARRVVRERRVAPDTPWRWDRAWGKGGEDAPRWRRAIKAAAVAVMLGALLAAGIAVVFTRSAPTPVRVALIAFSAVGLVPLWIAVRHVAEARRFGRTYLRWSPFPAFVGERITLRFGVTRAKPVFSRLTFRLRCVEESVVETTSADRSRTHAVAAVALFEAMRSLDAPDDMPRPRVDAVLSFEIPAGLPGNALDRDLPTYWELEVEGEAPGLDYGMRFLLPVYERG